MYLLFIYYLQFYHKHIIRWSYFNFILSSYLKSKNFFHETFFISGKYQMPCFTCKQGFSYKLVNYFTFNTQSFSYEKPMHLHRLPLFYNTSNSFTASQIIMFPQNLSVHIRSVLCIKKFLISNLNVHISCISGKG